VMGTMEVNGAPQGSTPVVVDESRAGEEGGGISEGLT
jgi:hypothetical protein